MKPYLHNLSSLRGIAAILVATLHFHFFLGAIILDKESGIINKLYLMVDLFFILSGFIMCYVYEDTFNKGIAKKSYKTFLIARFARIYPLHFLVLTAEVCLFLAYLYVGKFELLSDWNQHIYRLDAIPVQLLFLETVGIFDFATWNMPAWSLSAEWWAYMIFPFAFIAFKKIGYKKWILGLILVIALWFFIEFVLAPMQPFLTYPPNPDKKDLDVNWHWGTLRGIVGFIAGMIVWQVYKFSTFKNIFGKSWMFASLLILSAISMYLSWYDTITVFIFMMLILSSAYGSKFTNKLYAFKILRKLGDWSFSIYIWHMFIINLIAFYFMLDRNEKVNGILRPFNNSLFETRSYYIIFILVVILIGYLSFKYLEAPTRKWIKNKFKS
ncbi:acyltransferase family protein [Flavivirga eckloniae]|uniref:Acyltransferase 3 domain-containing protein n=1 Tax=Flavivirga eckloniae TaxID=1803846 RepID=A0A2K9PU61_9FLAO|nr:acyltransferase [Flavivirga eckloniae]AUP80579.1 hypothetical protein C1H87_18415 [Flavivirga eckloniae]